MGYGSKNWNFHGQNQNCYKLFFLRIKIVTNFKSVNCKKEEEERVGFVSYK